MKYCVIVENGLIEERVFPLKTRLTIGRAPENDIVLGDSSVSRHHAVIHVIKEKPTVEDLGSSNSIFVNGEQIDKVTLYNGDKLRIGRISLRLYQGEHFPKRVGMMETQVMVEISKAPSLANLDQLSHDQSGPTVGYDTERIEAIESELEKFREIQRDFFPNQMPDLPNWEIATCLHPAHEATGDFYDAFRLPGDYVGLVIADVCDKGMGSALFMSLIRSLIRVFSGETRLPGFSISHSDKAVDQFSALRAIVLTNDYIAQEHGHTCMFATVFLGVLNPTTGLLVYINGGHEPLYIVSQTGKVQTLTPTGPAVGIMPCIEFKAQEVQLELGDILVGYTDGVTEAHAPNGELFTRKRLLSLLQEPAPSASAVLERVKANLFAHIADTKPSDDITMIALQRASIAEG
jgi:serine phosphatase RsbU (regulator of sigma subunit)